MKIIEIIVAILIFIVIRAMIIVLNFLSNTISKIPIIKQFNKAGGIIYGLLKAFLWIYVLLIGIFIITSIKGDSIIYQALNNSIITKFLYNRIIIKNDSQFFSQIANI